MELNFLLAKILCELIVEKLMMIIATFKMLNIYVLNSILNIYGNCILQIVNFTIMMENNEVNEIMIATI